MLFEASVKDVFGLNNKGPVSDAVGIEIEMELAGVVDLTNVSNVAPGWTIKSDGSLRNYGVEFVSEPTSVRKGLGNLLGGWDKLLSDKMLAARIEDCPRASVHVHVNVRDYTYNQLFNAIVAYTLLEGVLVAYCGKYRLGNLFALRIPEANANFTHIIRKTRKYTPFALNGDHRYGALNLCSLSRFGTIEFRSMGSVYAPEAIDLWVNGLHHMVDHAARNFKNPPEVYRRYTELHRQDFIREFLGPLAGPLLAKGLNVDDLMEDGEEYAISLLACHPDNWTYETDFRKNKEFLEAVKTNYGYSQRQILKLDSDSGESILRSWKPKASGPTIDPVSSDFQNWVPFSEAEPPREAFDERDPPIQWSGDLPPEAFRNMEDWNTYIDWTENMSEQDARREAWSSFPFDANWVNTHPRRRVAPRASRPAPSISFNIAPGSVITDDMGTTATVNVTTTNVFTTADTPSVDWASLVPPGSRAVNPFDSTLTRRTRRSTEEEGNF